MKITYEEAKALVWARNAKKLERISDLLMTYDPKISISANARRLGCKVKALTALVKNYKLKVFKAKNQYQ